jgi:HlyD family secretion protein
MITGVNVALGDEVKSGDVLLINDSSTDVTGVRGMRARAENLRVRIAQTRKEAERLKSLLKGKAASTQDAERAELEVKELEAQLKETLFNIEDALEIAPEKIVRAPVSGLVTEVYIARGDTVTPGARLIEITDMGVLYIKVDLIEADAAKVKTGDRVIFVNTGKEGRITRMDAKVREILSELGVLQKRVTVEIEADVLPNPRFGADVDLAIIIGSREQAILVPRKAVFQLNGRDYAFVVLELEKTVELKELTIGLKGKDNYEILSGLSEGDQVVVSPNVALKDGGRINIELITR